MPSQRWPFKFQKSMGYYRQERPLVTNSPVVLYFSLFRVDEDDHFQTQALIKDEHGQWNSAPILIGIPSNYAAGFGLTFVAEYWGERIENGPVRPGFRDGAVGAEWRTEPFPKPEMQQ